MYFLLWRSFAHKFLNMIKSKIYWSAFMQYAGQSANYTSLKH